MGNMKYPRPADINFPEVKEKKWIVSVASEKQSKGKRYAKDICLLKSGNILTTSFERDETEYIVKFFFSIYSVPDLKLVEKYEYDYEEEGTFYLVNFAIQSKKGNIFFIGDKLYIFDGEAISKGPISNSEEINDKDFYNIPYNFFSPFDEEHIKPIKKNAKFFLCKYLYEVKEDIFLYTYADDIYDNESIFLLDLSEQKIDRKEFFHYLRNTKWGPRNYRLDIVLISEYYPENIYIIGNIELPDHGGYESVLLCFNIEKFLKQKKIEKEPLFKIQTSKSEFIYGMCEYDKKYLILDSYVHGIYIIDIESKQKVAVTTPKLYDKQRNKFWNIYSDRKHGGEWIYKKIIKFKDGQIFVMGMVINIRAQKCEEIIVSGRITDFVVSGDYLIVHSPNDTIFVYEIKEEED